MGLKASFEGVFKHELQLLLDYQFPLCCSALSDHHIDFRQVLLWLVDKNRHQSSSFHSSDALTLCHFSLPFLQSVYHYSICLVEESRRYQVELCELYGRKYQRNLQQMTSYDDDRLKDEKSC